ncbi:hypothetical protein Tco_1210647 [Tanacetum coccineum]
MNSTPLQDTIGKRRNITRRRHGKVEDDMVRSLSSRPDPRSNVLTQGRGGKGKGVDGGFKHGQDEDLLKPYKEILKSSFTRRIIKFSAPSHRTPTNLKIYNGSTDPDDHVTRFVGVANQGEWEMPVWCRMFQQTLDGPTRAFMCNSKCPELARRFFDQVPKTVTEIMRRVDDFVKSKEAYKSTELPNGEHPEKRQGTSYWGNRPSCMTYGGGHPRMDNYNNHNCRNHYQPCVSPRPHNQRRQLEAALESEKLSHLVKDVRQRGNNRGRQPRNNNGQGKVINMVWERGDSRKRKSWRGREEDWMNIPITFPTVLADNVFDDPLIVEAEVEGYLVRRVFADQGAAVQVMFEHCCDNLPSSIKTRLTPTQIELVGFFGEQLVPIWKVVLEATFESDGLCRRTMMKFMVVRASSLYNIILGRTGMIELKIVSSTIHAMVKFSTPRGIATLVARTTPVYECRWLEKKVKRNEKVEEVEPNEWKESRKEKVLVNPAFLEQKLTIDT